MKSLKSRKRKAEGGKEKKKIAGVRERKPIKEQKKNAGVRERLALKTAMLFRGLKIRSKKSSIGTTQNEIETQFDDNEIIVEEAEEEAASVVKSVTFSPTQISVGICEFYLQSLTQNLFSKSVTPFMKPNLLSQSCL